MEGGGVEGGGGGGGQNTKYNKLHIFAIFSSPCCDCKRTERMIRELYDRDPKLNYSHHFRPKITNYLHSEQTSVQSRVVNI